jgi:hypothetical protein
MTFPHARPCQSAGGPNRAEYLAKFTDAEWWLWMALGGVMPARVRERFKVELGEMRRQVEVALAKREADEVA